MPMTTPSSQPTRHQPHASARGPKPGAKLIGLYPKQMFEAKTEMLVTQWLKEHDADGDESLSLDETRQLLKKLASTGLAPEGEVPEEAIMATFDKDGGGTIDYGEILLEFTKKKAVRGAAGKPWKSKW